MRVVFLAAAISLVVLWPMSAEACGTSVPGPNGPLYVSFLTTAGGVDASTYWSIPVQGADITVSQRAQAGRFDPSGSINFSITARLPGNPGPGMAQAQLKVGDLNFEGTFGEPTIIRDEKGEAWSFKGGMFGYPSVSAKLEQLAQADAVTLTLVRKGQVVAGPWTVKLDQAGRQTQLSEGWSRLEAQRANGQCKLLAIQPVPWDRKPSAAEILKVTPRRAIAEDINGVATLSCTITNKGLLADCSVVSETPGGYGFGEAALKLVKFYRVKPTAADGSPVGGATARIPVRFWGPEGF